MLPSVWKQLDSQLWIARRRSDLTKVQEAVKETIHEVESNGDEGLRRLTSKFDKIQIGDFKVKKSDIQSAYSKINPEVVKALRKAANNIERFHSLQKSKDLWMQEVEPGITLGVKTTPLQRVGVYAPGGRAAYPSTILMCVIPAKVAGVEEVCCCSPPPINPMVLVAADIAGVDEVFQVGGAQAIAAMALGTESIKPVQKIVGPGNVYVTAAKMMLRDRAEIDFPAGPSEIAIIADSSANPEFVAADIMAQAEHDPQAGCLLITIDDEFRKMVENEILSMLGKSNRKDTIEKALNNSGFIITGNLREAARISNEIGPEHLSIQTKEPMKVLEEIRNAGSIFIGPYSAVACGDYASGTNHVLPTAGYSRIYSGLNVGTFCKTSTLQEISKNGLKSIGSTVQTLAKAEGLEEHAKSIEVRLKK